MNDAKSLLRIVDNTFSHKKSETELQLLITDYFSVNDVNLALNDIKFSDAQRTILWDKQFSAEKIA